MSLVQKPIVQNPTIFFVHDFTTPNTIRCSFRCKDEIKSSEETPKSTSLCGSLTVEASVVLPVFLCLMIFVMYFMRIMWTQIAVQNALDKTSQQLAVVAAYQENLTLKEAIVICDAYIAEDDKAPSFINLGKLGLNYTASSLDDNYVALRLTYEIDFPIKMFGNLSWTMAQVSINRKWVGWDASEDTSNGEYVYVTEYADVYHTKLSCSYLNPSISAVAYSSVSKKRNSSGHKYVACVSCITDTLNDGTVYITEYGTSYHVSLTCSGLKRTISRKSISEVSGISKCSKCGE